MYDSSSNLCTIRPLPNNSAFLILVAFISVAVMVPFNAIFSLVLTLLCSKRPRLEALGLNSLEWLGSSDPAVRKKVASAAEELERIIAVVRSVQGALNHYCERKATGLCSPDEIEGMDHVLWKLGLFTIENKIELTKYSKLWWTDTNQCIRFYVERSLKEAREIQRSMEQYSKVSEKESYLIQHFLINRFSFLHRASLKRFFSHRTRDVPRTIHPVPWLLGWLFIIASLFGFVAWLLWWGISRAHDATVSNWGVNLALINFQEAFIFSVARIFFINVLAIEMIRPRLKNLHKYLIAKAEETRGKGTSRVSNERERSRHFLLQYLDPLLWAAKLSGTHTFDNVSDSDVSKLSEGLPVSVDDETHE